MVWSYAGCEINLAFQRISVEHYCVLHADTQTFTKPPGAYSLEYKRHEQPFRCRGTLKIVGMDFAPFL